MEAGADTEAIFTSLFLMVCSSAFLQYPGPLAQMWHPPLWVGSPTSIISEENAKQTCLQAFSNLGCLFPNDSSLSQVDMKLASIDTVAKITNVSGMSRQDERGERVHPFS